jgi:ferredoxin
VSAHTVPTAPVIRPPGSLTEEEFLGRCIKCAACMRVCPTNVLQPALLEAGLEGLWTPLLVNRIGWCEQYCVACGQACPTGAIRRISVAEKAGQPPFEQPIRLGTAFYDHGRCLPWAMHIPCIVCEEMCPTSPKAIWYKVVQVPGRDGRPIELKQPYVEPGLCIGCGICENKCPVEDLPAIRVSSVGETRSTTNQMLLKGSSA